MGAPRFVFWSLTGHLVCSFFLQLFLACGEIPFSPPVLGPCLTRLPSQTSWAAITTFHGLVASKQLFLTGLEAGSPRSGVPHAQVLGKPACRLQTAILWLCPHVRKGKGAPWGPFVLRTDPFPEDPTLMTIISQGPTSYCHHTGVGCQPMDLGGTQALGPLHLALLRTETYTVTISASQLASAHAGGVSASLLPSVCLYQGHLRPPSCYTSRAFSVLLFLDLHQHRAELALLS